jgi:hypothetical protein
MGTLTFVNRYISPHCIVSSIFALFGTGKVG